MILFAGQLYPTSEQQRLIDELEDRINATLSGDGLPPGIVIDAIARLGEMLRAGELDGLLREAGFEEYIGKIRDFAGLLSRDYLTYKLRTELGEGFFAPSETAPRCGLGGVRNVPMPLGVILHIAAGNMDALPAYTVVEGLLTGNVNLLKLPQADSGLTLAALAKLIEIEPSLSYYIYVFDTPSSDIATMRRLTAMADGIAVWGGDAAVSAVRAMAPPGVKLIEWGHRLSFAYLSGDWREKSGELAALAEHIVSTEQLLCSSCQTVFLDTDSMAETEAFCASFLPLLQRARDAHPMTDVGAVAEITLKRYTAGLEAAIAGTSGGGERLFEGRLCSLTACEDSELTLSDLFGRVNVKRLPRERMTAVLRRRKGYLQTAGLICAPEDRDALTEQLIRCGVNRVTSAGHMSAGFSGESHDGEYALRRYVRMANVEIDSSGEEKVCC